MAAEPLTEFADLVRRRSAGNRLAVDALTKARLPGHVIGLLRQELDSLIRVVYMLSLPLESRYALAQQTLAGKPWRLNGRRVTDRQMVELTDKLHGWTRSVYQFGCSFIHLSNLHAHLGLDPFVCLSPPEQTNVAWHLHNYHGWPVKQRLTLSAAAPYLPRAFEKISSNLDSYLPALSKEEVLDL